MNAIDATFHDRKFNVARYMLRYIVGASSDDIRKEHWERITKYRMIADKEIAGLVDDNYMNFNSSLSTFAALFSRLHGTCEQLEQVRRRSADGKIILSSKTKNLRELLLQKYEAKKVIDLIDEVQYIETAPQTLQAHLQDKNFIEAVHTFTKALDLVFSEKLVAFPAITGLRNSLMDCKELIEEKLIENLKHVIYMKDILMISTEYADSSQLLHKVCQNSVFDHEFDKHTCVGDKEYADDQSTLRKNELVTTITAIKRLQREVEVLAELQNSIECELNDAVSRIQSVFNTCDPSHDNVATASDVFGTHPDSTKFQNFLHTLLHYLRQVIRRHILTAYYFHSEDGRTFDIQSIYENTSDAILRILHESVGQILDTDLITMPGLEGSNIIFPSKLFSMSIHSQSRMIAATPMRIYPPQSKNLDLQNTRIFQPSVFHLPNVNNDLVKFSEDTQRYYNSCKLIAKSGPQADISFQAKLELFVRGGWMSRLTIECGQYLSHKNRAPNPFSPPSDTSFQLHHMSSMLHIINFIDSLIRKLPHYASELIAVLDTTIAKWHDNHASIAGEIQKPTLNEQLINSSPRYPELRHAYSQYSVYKNAKRHALMPSHMTSAAVETLRAHKADSSHRQAHTTEDQNPISTQNSSSLGISPSESDAVGIVMKLEFEVEHSQYSIEAWQNETKTLLTDTTRLTLLGCINKGCDHMTASLIGFSHSDTNFMPPNMTQSGSDASISSLLPATLQRAALRCSDTADNCLFFLRREVRLRCLFFLTRLTRQRFDMEEASVTSAHDCVMALNASLSTLQHALQPFVSEEKMAFVFDAIDALQCNIVILSLQKMPKCKFTKGGILQMITNINALHQGLSGFLYDYPTIRATRNSYYSQHAKRYYQLLLLTETQLEVFLIENRKAYSVDAFRALWRVETPHRLIKPGSINKLDSILR